MYTEELTEQGIVKETKDGIAEIIILNSDHCEECTAKIYCKSNSDDYRSISLKDTIGLKPGDFVLISVRGSKILQTTFFLYGMPLIILFISLFAGFNIFSSHKELFSTLSAFLFLGVYFLSLRLRFRNFYFPVTLLKIIQKRG